MYHSKLRRWHASVYLGEYPELLDEDEDGHLYDEEGQAIISEYPNGALARQLTARLQAEALSHIVQGKPDTEYHKFPDADMVVSIPDNCSFWVDEEKLVILGKSKLCSRCHSLLLMEDGVASCMKCMMIYEV